MLPEEDRIRIQHMFDATKQAIEFAHGISQQQLVNDLKTTFALVKCIEIIGEAAVHVSDATKESVTTIPWRIATAMRNRLIHVYFDVDIHILWATVANDLPKLASLLKEVLASQTGPNPPQEAKKRSLTPFSPL